jgi:release factor glutamine methyltransferase
LTGAWSEAAERSCQASESPGGSGSIRLLLEDATQTLAAAGIGAARREAEWLLSHAMGCSPLELYLGDGRLAREALVRFLAQVKRRAGGVPLQYLLGEAECCGVRVAVEPGVFIPRPETESVIEAFIGALGRPTRRLRLLDLGTGSAGIALALAQRLPTCVIVGVELSWLALQAARRNIVRHQLAPRIHLVHGRWLTAVRGLFDGIIANPPYVPTAEVARLPFEVRQEPSLSLDGGPDGMRDLIEIIAAVPRALADGGVVALECGETQAPPLMRAAAVALPAARLRVVYDLAGRRRGVLAQLGGGRSGTTPTDRSLDA